MKEQLTAKQMELVESALQTKDKNNRNMVEREILFNVKFQAGVSGLEFDDLYQVGCIGLCKAATLYDGSTQFNTYAAHMIRNEIVDHVRSISRREKRRVDKEFDFLTLVDEENQYNAYSDDFLIAQALHYLQKTKKEQSGCVRKGLEVMELRIQGYTGGQIAKMYGTESNKVTAWVSKARQKIRDDAEFQQLIADIRG